MPPKKKPRRSRPIRFNIWLSVEERKRFDAVALALGVSMADAVRLLVSERAARAA